MPENNPGQDLTEEDTPLGPAEPETPGKYDLPNTPDNPEVLQGEMGTDLPDDGVPQSGALPSTGEVIMTVVWIGLLAASGIGMPAMLVPKKRNRT